ncbi:MAG TPA: hypothetical protein VK929_12630 [Longimicrobiales bacterium]|nr:hypothetical protein [Longimicrobiales bacterium]
MQAISRRAGFTMGRRGPFRRSVAGLMAVVLTLSSCYHAAPLTSAPQPGMRVALTLTQEGSAGMQNTLGQAPVRVEGEVAGVAPDRWDLHVFTVGHYNGQEVAWNRERVTIPTSYMAMTEQRQLDQRKTWIAVGIGVVAALIVGRTFISGFLGSESNKDDGEVPPH